MLRRLTTTTLSAASRQYAKPQVATPRFLSSFQPLYHSHDDKPHGGHTHSHNATPCSGHGNSHNHGTPERNTLKIDKPMLMLAFTCKKCDTRSSHVMSKQAYSHGTILVKCPGCQSRHLIADHLKIFSDHRIKLEDIMKAQGESVSTDTSDLVFEDIPESLKNLIGHHAKDAPAEYQQKEQTSDESPKLAASVDNGNSEKK